MYLQELPQSNRKIKFQLHQDNINIKSDLVQAGITSGSDFADIEKQISSKYAKPEEIMQQHSSISLMEAPVTQGYNIPSVIEESNIEDLGNLEKNSSQSTNFD